MKLGDITNLIQTSFASSRGEVCLVVENLNGNSYPGIAFFGRFCETSTCRFVETFKNRPNS